MINFCVSIKLLIKLEDYLFKTNNFSLLINEAWQQNPIHYWNSMNT